MEFPKEFVETIQGTWKAKGQAWLDSLPKKIQYCISKWNLINPKMCRYLSYNLIIFAETENSPQNSKVILKLCVPSLDYLKEVKLLQYYNGQGSVRLLDFDLENGAMLLEHVLPGIALVFQYPNQDDQAVSITADLIKHLHAKQLKQIGQIELKQFDAKQILSPDFKDLKFPTIEIWLNDLNKDYPGIPIELLKKARTLRDSLLATQKNPILLHGDLHHHNILQKGGSSELPKSSETTQDSVLPQTPPPTWVSIDPKGVWGELTYEVGAFIRNPIPLIFNHPNLEQLISHRIHLFSKLLELDETRLTRWCFVQAVLSACWCLQDGIPFWKEVVNMAEVINKKI